MDMDIRRRQSPAQRARGVRQAEMLLTGPTAGIARLKRNVVPVPLHRARVLVPRLRSRAVCGRFVCRLLFLAGELLPFQSDGGPLSAPHKLDAAEQENSVLLHDLLPGRDVDGPTESRECIRPGCEVVDVARVPPSAGGNGRSRR
eukprot:5812366-Prymnesium_polylepis.1